MQNVPYENEFDFNEIELVGKHIFKRMVSHLDAFHTEANQNSEMRYFTLLDG